MIVTIRWNSKPAALRHQKVTSGDAEKDKDHRPTHNRANAAAIALTRLTRFTRGLPRRTGLRVLDHLHRTGPVRTKVLLSDPFRAALGCGHKAVTVRRTAPESDIGWAGVDRDGCRD
eukprot:101199-Rhodomonas_salina.2